MSIKDDGWGCACVKRGKDGVLKAIRINARSLERCPKCGATRADADRIAAKYDNEVHKRKVPRP